jgi:class 3 adenylate cyclase
MFMMFTIAGAAYVTSSLSADEQKSQRLHLLSQCFSPAVVKKLTQSPEVMDRFYEQWMSVFFVDIRGFTQASEASREDIEGLALRLRNVMDIGYREIVVTHEGIVDKFMGDAIMGWIGGHFSKHWDIFAAERRALLADEIEEATQDLRAVERAIRARETGAGLSGERRVNDSVSPAELETDLAQLNEAKRRIQAGLEDLADRRRTAIQENPGLDERYETRVLAYKRAVARSAAMCCLTIWDEVSNQDAAEAFTELKIGIASGPVMVGNFGATRQVGFTVLGPTVNRAARLEPASAQCGCKILVDQDTFALLGDDPELVFRELPVISVKGVDADLRVYEPLRKDGVSSQALNAFRLAAEAILADRLADAIERLREADRLWEGGDHASQLWAKECEKAVREGYSLKFRKMSK